MDVVDQDGVSETGLTEDGLDLRNDLRRHHHVSGGRDEEAPRPEEKPRIGPEFNARLIFHGQNAADGVLRRQDNTVDLVALVTAFAANGSRCGRPARCR